MSDIRDNPRRNDTRMPRYTPIIFPPRDHNLDDMMVDYLARRDLNAGVAYQNGWYPTNDAGVPRIVIPGTMTSNGRFWQARAMVVGIEPRYASPHAPRENAVILVEPREMPPWRAAIVEGPMCALAAAGEGLVGIAMMGNSPPLIAILGVVELVRCLGVTGCLVIDDSDTPGSLAQVQSHLSLCPGITSLLTVAYPGKDLAACSRDERQKILK